MNSVAVLGVRGRDQRLFNCESPPLIWAECMRYLVLARAQLGSRVGGIGRSELPSGLPPHIVDSVHLAGILLRTCALPNLKTVFSFSRNWLPGWHLWKTCIAFAVIQSSRWDTNLSRYICSRRPWESDRDKHRRPSGSVSVRRVPSRWLWDLHPRAHST